NFRSFQYFAGMNRSRVSGRYIWFIAVTTSGEQGRKTNWHSKYRSDAPFLFHGASICIKIQFRL
ncbi:MAG: hypothetical protein WBN49_02300, partial [Arenicellales bacterium]